MVNSITSVYKVSAHACIELGLVVMFSLQSPQCLDKFLSFISLSSQGCQNFVDELAISSTLSEFLKLSAEWDYLKSLVSVQSLDVSLGNI